MASALSAPMVSRSRPKKQSLVTLQAAVLLLLVPAAGPSSRYQPLHPAQHGIAVEESNHLRLDRILSRSPQHCDRDDDIAPIIEGNGQQPNVRRVGNFIRPAAAFHPPDLYGTTRSERNRLRG